MDNNRPSRPRVSVIVAVYNSEAYLRDCIESLLAVDAAAGDVELIFVDNGSTDGSLDIARSYAALTVLEEPTRGAYPARNAGIMAARAPVIAFTDADCTVDKAWVRVLLEHMEQPAAGLLLGQVLFPREASLLLHTIGNWENAKAAFIAQKGTAGNRIAYCNNMAVRASLFSDLGLFRPWKRAGDSEFAQRVAQQKPDLAFAFDPRMKVTHHEFLRARDRARRLQLYTGTNTQIEGFRELTFGQRMRILGGMLAGSGR